MKRLKLQLIEWEDHASYNENVWQSTDDLLRSKRGILCSSVGYIILENKHIVTVASTISVGERGQVRRLGSVKQDQTILKRCILKRRNLKE